MFSYLHTILTLKQVMKQIYATNNTPYLAYTKTVVYALFMWNYAINVTNKVTLVHFLSEGCCNEVLELGRHLNGQTMACVYSPPC